MSYLCARSFQTQTRVLSTWQLLRRRDKMCEPTNIRLLTVVEIFAFVLCIYSYMHSRVVDRTWPNAQKKSSHHGCMKIKNGAVLTASFISDKSYQRWNCVANAKNVIGNLCNLVISRMWLFVNPVLLDFPNEFHTERLLIRMPKPGDGKQVYKSITFSINELRPWLPFAQHDQSEEETEFNIRKSHAQFIMREDLRLLIFLKESNQFIGSSGLHHPNWDIPKFEIGYWIDSRFVSLKSLLCSLLSGPCYLRKIDVVNARNVNWNRRKP